MGEPTKILKAKVVNEEMEKKRKAKLEEKDSKVERDPLESTEEEDEDLMVEKMDLLEIDRLHCHVRAIEHECHIVPQGSMKLN